MTSASAQQTSPQYPYGPAPMQQQPSAPTSPATQSQYPYGPNQAGPYGGGAPAYGTAPAPVTSSDEDSGRSLEFFYARVSAGGAFASLDALGGDKFLLRDGSGGGGAFELGLGVRLLVLTVGPRARALVLSNAMLWQLGGEVALRLPLGKWDPFVGIQGGYTFGSRSSSDFAVTCPNCSAVDVAIGGADVGLAGGADYYLSPNFSLGGDLALMLLFLSRDAIHDEVQPALAERSSASATGFGAKLGVHAGLHF